MLSLNQIEDIKAQAFIGKPAHFADIAKIYPLLIPEILEMGLNKYYAKLGILLLTEIDIQKIIKEKIKKTIPLEQLHPLQYLLSSAEQNDSFLLELQSAFFTFCQEDIILLPKINSVVVGDPKQQRLITEENFKDFQDILRIQNGREIKAPPPPDETPGERIMRLKREQVEEVKRKQAQKNNENESSFAEQLEIASVFGININQCTIYSLQKLIMRHRLKEKWENDIQMLCAGADATKIKASYWGETIKK